jgi:hypothetical protein
MPPEKRIDFRIAINVGDIFGDGVSVMARLERLAEPGDICVSARARGAGLRLITETASVSVTGAFACAAAAGGIARKGAFARWLKGGSSSASLYRCADIPQLRSSSQQDPAAISPIPFPSLTASSQSPPGYA